LSEGGRRLKLPYTFKRLFQLHSIIIATYGIWFWCNNFKYIRKLNTYFKFRLRLFISNLNFDCCGSRKSVMAEAFFSYKIIVRLTGIKTIDYNIFKYYYKHQIVNHTIIALHKESYYCTNLNSYPISSFNH